MALETLSNWIQTYFQISSLEQEDSLIGTLPDEILQHIFRFLPVRDLFSCLRVNRNWQKLTSENSVMDIERFFPNVCFLAKDWKNYFDVTFDPPPISNRSIISLLMKSCPFWDGKRIYETHIITLLPKEINENKFTLNLLGEMIKRPNEGYSTQFKNYDSEVRHELGEQGISCSTYVCMTKEVIPNSLGYAFQALQEIIASYRKKAGIYYELPYPLEGVTGIVMHYVKTGERIYSQNPQSFVRCQQELVDFLFLEPIDIGNFSAQGINIIRHQDPIYSGDPYCGSAAAFRIPF